MKKGNNTMVVNVAGFSVLMGFLRHKTSRACSANLTYLFGHCSPLTNSESTEILAAGFRSSQ